MGISPCNAKCCRLNAYYELCHGISNASNIVNVRALSAGRGIVCFQASRDFMDQFELLLRAEVARVPSARCVSRRPKRLRVRSVSPFCLVLFATRRSSGGWESFHMHRRRSWIRVLLVKGRGWLVSRAGSRLHGLGRECIQRSTWLSLSV